MVEPLPIALLLTILVSNAEADVCASFKDPRLFLKALQFSKEVCYFIPRNATRESNWRYSHDPDQYEYHKFYFDIAKARSICQSFDSSLPITKDRREIDFIFQRFNDFDYDPEWFNETGYGSNAGLVALGMQVPFCMWNRKWDDGARVAYAYYDPPYWSYGDFNSTECTYAALLDPRLGPEEAVLVRKGITPLYPIRVLCRYEPPGLAASKRQILASAAGLEQMQVQWCRCMSVILLAITAVM